MVEVAGESSDATSIDGARTPARTVLHVFDHSFPKGDGYAYRSGEIIRFTRRKGWQTAHVTSAKQGPTAQGAETANGLEFFRTASANDFWSSLPVLNQWSIVSGLRRRLEALIGSVQPVLLHVHSPCLNGMAALPVARKFGIPVIYEIRALWEDGAVDSGACREGDLRYRISRMLETYVCRRADHIVTICEGLRGEMLGRGLQSAGITVVPNSVDLDRFSTTGTRDEDLAGKLGLTQGKTLGFIGTFFPFEGLEVLVRALPGIRAREPLARVLLVGDGPDAKRIRELVHQLGIEDAVVFTGRVPHAEVERYYGLIDVLVYPRISKRVTELVTPLKPLEAMAQGKIVVASDVGGHREMVTPGRTGVLFKAGDPMSLVEACVGLLSRPEEWSALRESGKNYVSAARSWASNVQIYDELYERLIRPARQGH